MTDREVWDARYRERAPGARPPEPFLVGLADRLPIAGRALDVGGGDGRNALWLAARGLDTTVVDVSPEGLAQALANAREAGVSIRAVEADLEVDPLPVGPWDVICCCFYLNRRALAEAVAAPAPGGWLVVVHPTRTNLERHPKPSARFLLDDGELPRLVGVPAARYEEGWTNDRHLARLAARRGD